MVALLAEQPGAALRPPSVEALLAARIDGLPGDDSSWPSGRRSRCRVLAGGRRRVDRRADARRGGRGARAARATRPRAPRRRGAGAAFAHGLVRDAAYARFPKAVRASSTSGTRSGWRRMAGRARARTSSSATTWSRRRWPEGRPPRRPPRRAARRAGGPLTRRGGRRAVARGDARAGAGLLGRAVDLLPPGRTAPPAVRAGRGAHRRGAPRDAEAALGESAAAAAEAGDRRVAARTDLQRARLQLAARAERGARLQRRRRVHARAARGGGRPCRGGARVSGA